MAVAAYSAWTAQGRPLTPAQPIRELVERLREAFPAAAQASLFGWYADEGHYTAVPAEDHTPFSQTGWPVANPHWVVCATDVMHRPDLGVDVDTLGPYWLAEARAGRFPALKYMIYRGQLYDVRNGWQPQPNSDDPGHIHLSVRTDYINSTLGSWSPVPGGDDGMSADDVLLILKGVSSEGYASQNSSQLIRDHVPGNDVAAVLGRLTALVTATSAADEVRDKATLAAITAITSGPGGPDAAPIVAAVNAVRDEARAKFAELHTDLEAAKAGQARAEAALALLQRKITAGEQAQAAAIAAGV